MENAKGNGKATIKDIKEVLRYPTLKEFSVDWKSLSETDKAQIRDGISDGSMTY